MEKKERWERLWKKLEYFWDYYKWPTIGGITALCIVVYFAYMLWEGQQPCRLRVCVVLNTEDDCSGWFDRFAEELQSDGKDGAVDVNLDQPFDYDNQYYYVQEAEVMTTISSRRMDVAVCGEDMYSYLLALNTCLPLDESLPEELASTLADEGRLVQSTANLQVDENGETDPADGIDGYFAVDLSGTEFSQEYNQPEEGEPESLYAIVIANTEHLEDSVSLVRALVSK